MKCPFCGYEGLDFKAEKTWKFRFYDVTRYVCPRCKGVFNYYTGVSSTGKKSEFLIRVKPRAKTKTQS